MVTCRVERAHVSCDNLHTSHTLHCSLQNVSMPQVVKSRYGAWYLPVNLWQLRPSDEVCALMDIMEQGFFVWVKDCVQSMQCL